MCKAFSCIVTRQRVYWKAGIDSHERIRERFKIKDDSINTVSVEITPEKGYLHPESKWILRFDNTSEKPPEWWKLSHEKMCFEALEQWKKEVYSKINLIEAVNPLNPLLLNPVKKVSKTHIKLLVEWSSVWASVWASVRASVGDSVRASVGDPVWASVGDLVWSSVWASVWASVRASVGDSGWASVGDSVWAYSGSLFPKVKYKFDFSSNTKLWKAGLVPSFDGKTWRLHTGKDAHVVYELSKEEINKMKKKKVSE